MANNYMENNYYDLKMTGDEVKDILNSVDGIIGEVDSLSNQVKQLPLKVVGSELNLDNINLSAIYYIPKKYIINENISIQKYDGNLKKLVVSNCVILIHLEGEGNSEKTQYLMAQIKDGNTTKFVQCYRISVNLQDVNFIEQQLDEKMDKFGEVDTFLNSSGTSDYIITIPHRLIINGTYVRMPAASVESLIIGVIGNETIQISSSEGVILNYDGNRKPISGIATPDDSDVTAAVNVEYVMSKIGGNNLITSLAELNSAISGGITPISFSPEADIEISSTLRFPANTVILGNNAKIKRANGFNGKLISLGEDCKLSNLKIDGNRESVASPTWENTIEISTLARCVVENVVIEHGNEAIICYGDDVVVRHCQLTDCGGNGIHFSGGNRTRIENCTIIGANKKSGMGHEGGCISWSMACSYIICQNNYLEDALSGLGYIQWHEASHIKITGNTIKNCQKGIFAETTGNSETNMSSNILIANNHFISCGGTTAKTGIFISNANTNKKHKYKNLSISNNILEETSIIIDCAEKLLINGNIITGGYIKAENSPKSVISNNEVKNEFTTGIEIGFSKKTLITNNIIRSKTYCLHLGDSPFTNISANQLIQQCVPSGVNLINKLRSNGSTIESNNMFVYAGNCLTASNGDIVTNNHIDCGNADSIAIRIYGGVTGAIAEKNLTNGAFDISAYNSNCFTDHNLDLPQTEFLDVNFSLTNITRFALLTSKPSDWSYATNKYYKVDPNSDTGFTFITSGETWTSNTYYYCTAGVKVLIDDDYTGILNVSTGYTLPDSITVIMGGTATTNFTYNSNTGEVVIPNVTGALTITVEGV